MLNLETDWNGNGGRKITLFSDSFELSLDNEGTLECWMYLGDEGKTKLWTCESHTLTKDQVQEILKTLNFTS